MKSKVSVEVTDAYKTLAIKKGMHENASWHVDGDYDEAFKILVYLTDVTKKQEECFLCNLHLAKRLRYLAKPELL